jgi:hypothetical protein
VGLPNTAHIRHYLLLPLYGTVQPYCNNVNATDNFSSSILSYACSTVAHVNNVSTGVDVDPSNHDEASDELLLARVEAAAVFIAGCREEQPESEKAAGAAAGRAPLNINAVDRSCKSPLYWSVVVSAHTRTRCSSLWHAHSVSAVETLCSGFCECHDICLATQLQPLSSTSVHCKAMSLVPSLPRAIKTLNHKHCSLMFPAHCC